MRSSALGIAEHLQRVDLLGPALDAQEGADPADLLGQRVAVLGTAADQELESLVRGADPDRDGDLLRYFQRRVLREHELFRPAMRELEDQVAQPILVASGSAQPPGG